MKQLSSEFLRQEYLNFFKRNGHSVIPSASVLPENDPSVLFTTAGMHPLVPYLLGEKHPEGKRLTDVQKCVRTGDIDEVGDASHCTFFEMLGNWSLGDYFKEESIEMSWKFLTEILEIPKEKLAFSVFAGDADAARDEVAANKWISLGADPSHVFFLPKKNNWWHAGATGPCGPDTEIFYITDKEPCSENCDPSCDCGRYLEIWNNVFMEFFKNADGTYSPLSQKNVDTGMGLERTLCVLGGYKSVYDTDLFANAMKLIAEKSGKSFENPEFLRAARVIADHIRTAVIIMGDRHGVTPSNVDQGYVLRRLIRRSVRFGRVLELDVADYSAIASVYIAQYAPVYPEIGENADKVLSELQREVEKFNATLASGIKEFEKLLKYIQNNRISGKAAFRLYDTFGFPIEMTEELAAEQGVTVDRESFDKCFEEHRIKSHAGSEQKFKGGLQDSGKTTTYLHTATHLLLAALKKVLGDDGIQQKGSNITPERLRFDFNFPRALTQEEIAAVEAEVNSNIKAAIPVTFEEMEVQEAKAKGAVGVFDDRYSARVKVYKIGDVDLQICGGPHAENTALLKGFKITKEQSSSSGIRRIKAVISAE